MFKLAEISFYFISFHIQPHHAVQLGKACYSTSSLYRLWWWVTEMMCESLVGAPQAVAFYKPISLSLYNNRPILAIEFLSHGAILQISVGHRCIIHGVLCNTIFKRYLNIHIAAHWFFFLDDWISTYFQLLSACKNVKLVVNLLTK